MLTSWHSRVPLAADVERIERVVRAYIARIETRNNVALCQAEVCETDDACDPVPRVFAVATRPIPAGAELRSRAEAIPHQLLACIGPPAAGLDLPALHRSLHQLLRALQETP